MSLAKKPEVVIIGRPNVGKSTLFNRLVGKKLALVDDQPGVTRDRRMGDASIAGMDFTIVDTAGWEDEDPATLPGRMRKQTEVSLEGADAALFVIDARAGLTPLDNPKARANVCLDCHYGSSKPGQFVTHAMMAAGHPRISFELDLFSALQQHHQIDADYVARKGGSSSVRVWAVGQAEAVRRSTGLFAQPKFGYEGAFPQFYFLDCHSCHRTISDGPQRKLTFETNPGRPIPFGNPPFNDENMIMLSAVAGALVPGEAGAFQTAAREFHKAMGVGPAEARAAAQALSARAGALSDALGARAYAEADAFKVIAIIAGEATAPRFTDYAGSVQAVMAIDTLLNALVREGRITQGAAAGIRGDIARAYKAVEEPNAYRPGDFRAALKAAAGAIGRLG